MWAQTWMRDFVATDPGESCVVWPFQRTSTGYGKAWNPNTKRQETAGRVVWELAHGKAWPDDLDMRHLCGNGHLGCVNWKHIIPGTVAENTADRLATGRRLQGSRHPQAKLTEAKVVEMLALLADGATTTAVARDYGVSQTTVKCIWRGSMWSHVPGPREPAHRNCANCGEEIPLRARYCSRRCYSQYRRAGKRVYREYQRL